MRYLICLGLFFSSHAFAQQKSDYGIRHSIVISGPRTIEINEQDEVVWDYGMRSRDMTKLENGNYLITLRDEVLELSSDKQVVWKYIRTMNSELMSAERLSNGNTLVTELGDDPRLVEVNSQGDIAAYIPILPETDNHHMQTRMARKLKNGNYLVPHRIMPFVKEYDKDGGVVRIFRLDLPELGGPEAKNGSFAAVRLDDGSTVISCASGNRLVIFDKAGQLSWHLSSPMLGGVLNDVCGLQVLKNGNFLVSCYGNQAKDGLKMIEVNREKQIVWTYQNSSVKYVHNLQVLSTNGVRE